MALDKLPSTFHLRELHKGWFPHAFTVPANFQYRGPYPPAEAYNPDDMMDKKREKFLEWHDEKLCSGAIFDFQEKLLRYCESDVKLLKEGCLKFIDEFETYARFKPLIKAITIASACKLNWRREFLEENLITLESQKGWRSNHVNQS